MHKRIELDIPINDIECWEKYPKHRWVYDKTRLFDSQNILWRPYITDELKDTTPIISLKTDTNNIEIGNIFYNSPKGQETISELYIIRGEIKYVQHTNSNTGDVLDSIPGGTDIRIMAFISMHFQKYTGVLSIKTIGLEIIDVCLRSIQPKLALKANQEIDKIIKRIYKNR